MANVLSLSRAAGALRGGVCAVEAFSLFSFASRPAAVCFSEERGASMMYAWARISNRAEKSRARRNEPQSADADAAPTLPGPETRFAEASKGATRRADGALRISKTNLHHRASGRKTLALAGRRTRGQPRCRSCRKQQQRLSYRSVLLLHTTQSLLLCAVLRRSTQLLSVGDHFALTDAST